MTYVKILKYLLISLLGISGLLSILFYNSLISESFLINWSYFLIMLTILSSVIFPLINMLNNPKKAKIALLGVAFLVVLFIVSYSISGNSNAYILDDGTILATEKESRLSSAGLNLFYILGSLSIVVVIYTEISKSFK